MQHKTQVNGTGASGASAVSHSELKFSIRLWSSQHLTQGFSKNYQASRDISAAPVIKRSAEMNKADFSLRYRKEKPNTHLLLQMFSV